MARTRYIKPGFFKNQELGSIDPMARLFFAGLWTLADRDGWIKWIPRLVKAELFPFDDNADINGYLTVIERLKFVQRYASKTGCEYLLIANWHKHQRPHHTEKQSEIKALLDNGELTVITPLPNGEYPPLVPYNLSTLVPLNEKGKREEPFSLSSIESDPLIKKIREITGRHVPIVKKGVSGFMPTRDETRDAFERFAGLVAQYGHEKTFVEVSARKNDFASVAQLLNVLPEVLREKYPNAGKQAPTPVATAFDGSGLEIDE